MQWQYIYIFFFFFCSNVFWLCVSVSEGIVGLRFSEMFQYKSTVKVLAWTEVIHYYIVVLLRVGLADLEARVMVGFVQVFITYSDLGHFMFSIHILNWLYYYLWVPERKQNKDDGQEGERSSLTFSCLCVLLISFLMGAFCLHFGRKMVCLLWAERHDMVLQSYCLICTSSTWRDIQ